jgi:hypothetical protein
VAHSPPGKKAQELELSAGQVLERSLELPLAGLVLELQLAEFWGWVLVL